jgi:uncharacterized protein RhaS with RHS repeats
LSLGNRVYKKSTASGSATERKYVVDITGELPVILIDLNLTDSSLKRKYIYGDWQILAQHDIDDDAQPAQDDKYFYLHDRLGSVRLVIDDEGAVQNYYTYEPFGQTIESGGTLEDPFRFTGQYFDSEIEEYYLRARSPGDISVGDRPLWDMHYTPHIARFTSRDPVASDDSWLLPSARNLSCNSN